MLAIIQKYIAKASAGASGFQSALVGFLLKYVWNYGKKKIEEFKESRKQSAKLKEYKEKIDGDISDEERRASDRNILS